MTRANRSGRGHRPPPLVEMRNIRVAFGGVHAVDDVSVDLYPGEVVALVGGNGAGKTTLIRTLSGAHRADAGQILIEGTPVTINTPAMPRTSGSRRSTRPSPSPTTCGPANIFLGRELTDRRRSLDDTAMEDATRKLMSRSTPSSRTSSRPSPALRRPASVRRDRPGGALQRTSPDHGRADRRARSRRDRAGAPAHRAVAPGRARHLPDQPRHPPGLRLRRPDQRDDAGAPRRHRDKADVTKDEVLAMIIMGKKPNEVSDTEMRNSAPERPPGQPAARILVDHAHVRHGVGRWDRGTSAPSRTARAKRSACTVYWSQAGKEIVRVSGATGGSPQPSRGSGSRGLVGC